MADEEKLAVAGQGEGATPGETKAESPAAGPSVEQLQAEVAQARAERDTFKNQLAGQSKKVTELILQQKGWQNVQEALAEIQARQAAQEAVMRAREGEPAPLTESQIYDQHYKAELEKGRKSAESPAPAAPELTAEQEVWVKVIDDRLQTIGLSAKSLETAMPEALAEIEAKWQAGDCFGAYQVVERHIAQRAKPTSTPPAKPQEDLLHTRKGAAASLGSGGTTVFKASEIAAIPRSAWRNNPQLRDEVAAAQREGRIEVDT